MTTADQAETYLDQRGWVITVPPGWHVLPFNEADEGVVTSGVQLSSVPLPPPSVLNHPLQVNGRVLPADGVGLIIANDTDPYPSHRPVTVPPLTWPHGWLKGSAPHGSPHWAGLLFRIGSTTFSADVTIGPRASSADLQALTAAIHSLREVSQSC